MYRYTKCQRTVSLKCSLVSLENICSISHFKYQWFCCHSLVNFILKSRLLFLLLPISNWVLGKTPLKISPQKKPPPEICSLGKISPEKNPPILIFLRSFFVIFWVALCSFSGGGERGNGEGKMSLQFVTVNYHSLVLSV